MGAAQWLATPVFPPEAFGVRAPALNSAASYCAAELVLRGTAYGSIADAVENATADHLDWVNIRAAKRELEQANADDRECFGRLHDASMGLAD